jgi:hypothetical protein
MQQHPTASLENADHCLASSATYVALQVGNAPTVPTSVLKIIALFDGSRSLEQICHEAQISVTKGLEIVRKLAHQGLIEPIDEPSRAFLSEVSEIERADTLRNLPPIVFVEEVERADTLQDLPALEDTGFSDEEEAFFASDVRDDCDESPVTLSDRFSLFVTDLLFRLRGSPAC